MPTILVLEDRKDMQLMIGASLKGLGDLIFAATVAEGYKAFGTNHFDLCLLDISLPDGDAFGFCAELRNGLAKPGTPILFLSGRAATADKVLAFQLGADDYITKPFEPEELRVRVMAKLRLLRERAPLQLGNIRLDLPTQRLFISDPEGGQERPVELSSLEFRILHYFVQHEDRVISRSQLFESVWGQNVHVYDRTVDTHVSHLRKKLANSTHSIFAVKGAGYSLRRLTQAALAA